MLRDAIRNGDLQVFGASTELTFKENVTSDDSLAALFAGVEMQEVSAASQLNDSGAAKEIENSNREEFVGDKVSPDLRELIASTNAPDRVKAILQVNDTNSQSLKILLARYGVKVDSRMPSPSIFRPEPSRRFLPAAITFHWIVRSMVLVTWKKPRATTLCWPNRVTVQWTAARSVLRSSTPVFPPA